MSAGGERLVFSIVLNNYVGGSPKDIEDGIAVRLAEFGRDKASTGEDPRVNARTRAPHPLRSAADSRLSSVECSWVKSC